MLEIVSRSSEGGGAADHRGGIARFPVWEDVMSTSISMLIAGMLGAAMDWRVKLVVVSATVGLWR
jgi:hypothetical protein